MERVAPPQVNYDNILPLAIESRSNRREFLPVNGASFSNSTGATICRIDVNADSMLDASHSYLECDLTNTLATGLANSQDFLSPNPFTPAWIQRLRIESGGVVIEDINEYSRLYAMLMLNQVPESYVKNNVANQGMYSPEVSNHLRMTAGQAADPAIRADQTPNINGNGSVAGTGTGGGQGIDELHYSMSAQGQLLENCPILDNSTNVDAVGNRPTIGGLTHIQSQNRIAEGASRRMCIPLVSGFLNMDKYIPLIMMNAGFTIELTLCDPNRIGLCQTESVAAGNGAFLNAQWSVSNVKYVAHLIDLDRSFYDRLRAVMESSGGVLQLAGQTYRHFVGSLPANPGPHTITLPARVKSVKSIFGTFIRESQMGLNSCYDTSVFQSANIDKYRFEIGSVRYPQTDVSADTTENQAELQKAWGKLGDYSHEQAYSLKHTRNVETHRDGQDQQKALLSAYFVGYDFEAFQRVSLEAGINTSDRSLPINFIVSRSAATTDATRADFYVLTDAIYYINLDGTVSVSV